MDRRWHEHPLLVGALGLFAGILSFAFIGLIVLESMVLSFTHADISTLAELEVHGDAPSEEQGNVCSDRGAQCVDYMTYALTSEDSLDSTILLPPLHRERRQLGLDGLQLDDLTPECGRATRLDYTVHADQELIVSGVAYARDAELRSDPRSFVGDLPESATTLRVTGQLDAEGDCRLELEIFSLRIRDSDRFLGSFRLTAE